jgi:hypothetical protein
VVSAGVKIGKKEISMSVDIERLEKRVAAMEARLAAEAVKTSEAKKAAERDSLLAEIASIEARIAADDEKVEEKPDEKKAAEEKPAEEKVDEKKAADEKPAEKTEEKADEKKASELDPNGIEEEITQDSLSEVESITHGEELTDAPSMNELARKAYVSKLKSASARLDLVADYLEKQGRKELAFRIDKVADMVDSKIKSLS